MKKNKLKSIVFRFIVLIFSVLLVFVLPAIMSFAGNDMSYIYSTFIGKKSPYNGILEIWNVDSFESGLKSKVSYLEKCALKFQKQNKGVYIVIRNLTEKECLNLIDNGKFPDIISCSYGVSDKISSFTSAYNESDIMIDSRFMDAGRKNDGKLYGLAWCVGYYCLISTKAKLEKAGMDSNQVSLNEIAYTSGYEYKIGKKNKKSVSITYATSDYLMPQDSLLAYNKARSIHYESKFEEEKIFKSQYASYGSFLNNEATILLGTQRDICRMMSREENGKISDVIYLALTNWTDLIQYAFMMNNETGLRRECAEKFALSLVESENQKRIEEIGMFPVIEVNGTSNQGVMRDITLGNFSVLEPKRLFL